MVRSTNDMMLDAVSGSVLDRVKVNGKALQLSSFYKRDELGDTVSCPMGN